VSPERRPTREYQRRPTPPAGIGDRWTLLWAALALGGFIWGTGCFKRKVNAPVPVSSGAQGTAGAAAEAGGARVPKLRTAPGTTGAPVEMASPPVEEPAAVAPIVPRGEPLQGLPEPLGNRRAAGHEPLWRVRARNY
jgi:hypothetical protein